jgi:hypothetical protein
MSEFPETDVHNRALNSGIPPEKFVVVGSGAIEAVVGPDARRALDTDIAVEDETYRQLRENHDLQEDVQPNGYRHLVGNGYDISVGWGGRSMSELQQRGYIHNGVHIVGLPDVYEHKQNRGLPKDQADLQIIRDRLYGDKILPDAMLQGELGFIKSFMPERLHDRPELLVAANGLVIVRTVFGHADEGVRTYAGSVETEGVPATYHEWKHSGLGAQDGQVHIDRDEAKRAAAGLPPKYTDNGRVAGVSGYTYHDSILGNGRRAVNPEGHDELQAAGLVVRHLESVGAPDEVVEGADAEVMSTTFNEAIKAQDIDPARGYVPLQQLGAGQDMSTFRRGGADAAIALISEDFFRQGYMYGAPLKKLVDQLNVERSVDTPPIRIDTVEKALALIDQHPDYPVTRAGNPPQKMTLRQAFVTHLRGSQGFCGNYVFQGGWEIGSPEIQAESAKLMGELADAVEAGRMTVVDAYAAAAPRTTTADSRHNTDVDTTTVRESTPPEGGEDSIAALRAAIEAGIAELPTAELAAIEPQLATAIGLITNTLATSANEQVADAVSQLNRAQELLAGLRTAIAGGIEDLQTYISRLR